MMHSRIVCTSVQRPTGMFTAGKAYDVVSVHGFYNNMYEVIDDLGHTRVVNSDSMRFVIGSSGYYNEMVDFAYFEIEPSE